MPKHFKTILFVISALLFCFSGFFAFVKSEQSGSGFSENLSRSLIALPQDGKVYLGWRFFKNDDPNTNFNVYRNNQKIAAVSNSTNYLDENIEPGKTYRYFVKPILSGNEGASSNEVSVNVAGRRDYISIPLRQKTTVANIVTGDLDGDGLLDWVIKIPEQINDDPQRDTYHLQAYRSNGEFLWDFDLGIGNDATDGGHIWANAYTVWDLDGDKKSEVIARIRHNEKYYLAIIDGITKNIKKEIEWPPQASWNQVREVLAIAYLNGVKPYIVLQIGTYGTVNLYAYDSNLNLYWQAHNLGDAYSSHGIYVIDYDFDGNDELLVGDNLVDEKGRLVWSQNLTHPDGVHPGNIDPSNPGYEVAFTMEGPWQMDKAKSLVVDMASGKVLWSKDKFDHLHSEGWAADVTDQYPGWEFFSHDKRDFHQIGDVNHNRIQDAGEEWVFDDYGSTTEGLCPYTNVDPTHNCMYVFSAKGEIIYNNWIDGPPIWWDDDNLWEFLHLRYPDEPRIIRYPNSVKKNFGNINAAHISIVGDFLGDFRDEFIVLVNGNELRIYTNTDISNKKLPTAMQDRYYRLQVSRTGIGYYNSGGQLLDPTAYFNFSGGQTSPNGGSPSDPVCGNGICESGESCSDCSADCGTCPIPKACNDGQDNDGDGKADYPSDKGCNSPKDDDENNPSSPSSCSNSFLDFFKYQIGTILSCYLGFNPSGVSSVMLNFTAYDIDSIEEGDWQINSSDFQDIPITGDGVTTTLSQTIPLSSLVSGTNTVSFRFASDLNKSTQGFIIKDISLILKYPDINRDSKIDAIDLGILMSNWGKQDKGKHDLNSDGATNSQDFWELLKKWPNIFIL